MNKNNRMITLQYGTSDFPISHLAALPFLLQQKELDPHNPPMRFRVPVSVAESAVSAEVLQAIIKLLEVTTAHPRTVIPGSLPPTVKKMSDLAGADAAVVEAFAHLKTAADVGGLYTAFVHLGLMDTYASKFLKAKIAVEMVQGRSHAQLRAFFGLPDDVAQGSSPAIARMVRPQQMQPKRPAVAAVAPRRAVTEVRPLAKRTQEALFAEGR